MSGKKRPFRRVKRGEIYHKGPYWSLFMTGSLLAHAAFFIVVYGPFFTFTTGVKEEIRTPGLVYVDVKDTVSSKAHPKPDDSIKAPPEEVDEAADAKAQELPPPEESVQAKAGPPAPASLGRPAEDDGGVVMIRGQSQTFEPFAGEGKESWDKSHKPSLARLYNIDEADSTAFPVYTSAVRRAGPDKRSEGQTEMPRPPIARLKFGEVSGMPVSKGKAGTLSSINKHTAQAGPYSLKTDAASATHPEASRKAPVSVAGNVRPVYAGESPQAVADKGSLLATRPLSMNNPEAGPAGARPLSLAGTAGSEKAAPRLKIGSPAPGVTETRFVTVKGAVSGEGINSVVVVLGGVRKEVLVRGGVFESDMVLEKGRNLLKAYATDNSGEIASDSVEVVYAPSVVAVSVSRDLVVRVEQMVEGAPFELSYKWGQHPLADKHANVSAPEFIVEGPPRTSSVCVSKVSPGIYTIGLKYDTIKTGPASVSFDVTLFGSDPARRKNRIIGPVKLDGRGHLAAIRLLMPEGVFWDDDSWFTGVLESGRTTTKYKMPEGIVWKELE